MAEGWSNEKLAERFRWEINYRFEAEKRAWIRVHGEDMVRAILDPGFLKVFAKPDNRLANSWKLHLDTSFMWERYQNFCEINVENNSVKIYLFNGGYAIRPEIIPFFDHTAVSWSKASMEAVIYKDQPCIKLDLILIDYWDDERDAKWWVEHQWLTEEALNKLSWMDFPAVFQRGLDTCNPAENYPKS